jgi:hypothetical protein
MFKKHISVILSILFFISLISLIFGNPANQITLSPIINLTSPTNWIRFNETLNNASQSIWNETFAGNENRTFYITIPKNSEVIDAKLNLSGFNHTYSFGPTEYSSGADCSVGSIPSQSYTLPNPPAPEFWSCSYYARGYLSSSYGQPGGCPGYNYFWTISGGYVNSSSQTTSSSCNFPTSCISCDSYRVCTGTSVNCLKGETIQVINTLSSVSGLKSYPPNDDLCAGTGTPFSQCYFSSSFTLQYSYSHYPYNSWLDVADSEQPWEWYYKAEFPMKERCIGGERRNVFLNVSNTYYIFYRNASHILFKNSTNLRDWSGPYVVTSFLGGAGASWGIYATVNKTGAIYVVWDDGYGGITGRLITKIVSVDRGNTWIEKQNISSTECETHYCYFPSIVHTDYGYAVVYYGANYIHFKNSTNGLTWSTEKNIVSRHASYPLPMIGKDSQNNLYVVYTHPSSGKIAFNKSTDGGNTWSSAIEISDTTGREPHIYEDGSKKLWVLWQSPNNDLIQWKKSSDGGLTWGEYGSKAWIRTDVYGFEDDTDYLVLGSDGCYISLFVKNLPVNLNVSLINEWLKTCIPDANGNCQLPIKLHSDTLGKIQVSNINIIYDFNVSSLYKLSCYHWDYLDSVIAGSSVNKTCWLNNTNQYSPLDISIGGYYALSSTSCFVNDVAYPITGSPSYCAYSHSVSKGTLFPNLELEFSEFGSGVPISKVEKSQQQDLTKNSVAGGCAYSVIPINVTNNETAYGISGNTFTNIQVSLSSIPQNWVGNVTSWVISSLADSEWNETYATLYNCTGNMITKTQTTHSFYDTSLQVDKTYEAYFDVSGKNNANFGFSNVIVEASIPYPEIYTNTSPYLFFDTLSAEQTYTHRVNISGKPVVESSYSLTGLPSGEYTNYVYRAVVTVRDGNASNYEIDYAIPISRLTNWDKRDPTFDSFEINGKITGFTARVDPTNTTLWINVSTSFGSSSLPLGDNKVKYSYYVRTTAPTGGGGAMPLGEFRVKPLSILINLYDLCNSTTLELEWTGISKYKVRINVSEEIAPFVEIPQVVEVEQYKITKVPVKVCIPETLAQIPVITKGWSGTIELTLKTEVSVETKKIPVEIRRWQLITPPAPTPVPKVIEIPPVPIWKYVVAGFLILILIGLIFGKI